jgi:hypothetical protein
MRAVLRDLDSPDAPDGLDTFSPGDPRAFSILVQATIGPADGDGGDLFDFVAVGPEWFAENAPGKGFRWGHAFLILDRWDPQIVRRAIEDVCLHAEGRDWPEVASKISRFGQWEFENYRPASD